MSDIVERLRARSFRLATSDFNAHGAKLAFEAADEIEKLREALKPFAELADWYDTEPDTQPAWDSDYQPTVGQIRAARAAIGESDAI